ncbi:MAG: nucleotidyltransferase domain-containing protein [Planctomycetota bacterium]
MGKLQIELPRERIEGFCLRWKVQEFSLFGSVLTDEFGPESDVDVLVVFEEGAGWDLWDIVAMQEELKEVFGREVDLVEKRALRNPFRRHHILKTHEVIHVA